MTAGASRGRTGRALTAFGLVVVVVAVAVALWAVVGRDASDLADARDGRMPASSGPGPTADPGPPGAAPTPTPAPTPTRHVTRPTRISIPAIDVDARLTAVGLNDDGSMEVPEFGRAAWYDLGPRPGEPGPAVIVAHVDSYEGPDVFFRLRELVAGDRIRVRHRDGSSSHFVVRAREQRRKEELPVGRIWNDTRRPVLRLVTCGGDFDRGERSYRSNVIVYATLAPA